MTDAATNALPSAASTATGTADASVGAHRVTALARLLDLRETAPDVFEGDSGRMFGDDGGLYGSIGRRFGGELLAQALRAAQRTIDDGEEGRPVHSLHAYFIRPAHPSRPVTYRVLRVRDGRSFSSRSVEGWQDDAIAFVLDASFQCREPGFEHAAAAPVVPPPEDVPGEAARHAAARAAHPERFAGWPTDWYADRGPFETRTVEDLWAPGTHPPCMNTWVRLRAPLAAPALQPAIAAYYSDDPIMDNALLPHVGRFHDGSLTTASLDHAMWFHAPIDLSEWHLFAQDSPIAHGARGLTRGQLFDRSGRLVASVAQEILMRPRG